MGNDRPTLDIRQLPCLLNLRAGSLTVPELSIESANRDVAEIPGYGTALCWLRESVYIGLDIKMLQSLP